MNSARENFSYRANGNGMIASPPQVEVTMKEIRPMPAKTDRKTTTSRKTASLKGQKSTYAERWDLSHLAENPTKHFEILLAKIESQVAQFETARAQFSPTMEITVFHPLLTLSENIAAASSKLSAYAYLWFSENTKDLAARSFKDKVEERLTSLQNRMVFFDLWWQSVDAGNANRLILNRLAPVSPRNHSPVQASHAL